MPRVQIPSNVTFDQAATIPLALATSAVALYHSGERAIGGTCGLTPPWGEGGRGKYAGQPTIVFGGASTVGQASKCLQLHQDTNQLLTERIAIQLLRLSGFSPLITTASPRNIDSLKSLGATHVLDRNLSTEALHAEIKKIADKPITTIYDAVGSPETQNLGYDLLGPGGVLAAVQPDSIKPEKKVSEKNSFFMMGDLNCPPNRKLGASLYSKLTELLAEEALKVRLWLCCRMP